MTLRYLSRGASLSACGRYRFTLDRSWNSLRPLSVFIGVNPSTADAFVDDATIRRCVGFSASFGCGSYRMLNLFAWRATDVRELLKPEAMDRREENDAAIPKGVAGAAFVVCAWGSKSGRLGALVRQRATAVVNLLKSHGHELHCLRATKDGSPEHPLYLPGNLKPIPFEASNG